MKCLLEAAFPRVLLEFSASARRSSRCVCRGSSPATSRFDELVLWLCCCKKCWPGLQRHIVEFAREIGPCWAQERQLNLRWSLTIPTARVETPSLRPCFETQCSEVEKHDPWETKKNPKIDNIQYALEWLLIFFFKSVLMAIFHFNKNKTMFFKTCILKHYILWLTLFKHKGNLVTNFTSNWTELLVRCRMAKFR